MYSPRSIIDPQWPSSSGFHFKSKSFCPFQTDAVSVSAKNCSQFLLIKDSLKPDPPKVKAILNMKRPDDVVVLQMDMEKEYTSKFLGDLPQMCEPIRRPTHEDVLWYWVKKQQHGESLNGNKSKNAQSQ